MLIMPGMGSHGLLPHLQIPVGYEGKDWVGNR